MVFLDQDRFYGCVGNARARLKYGGSLSLSLSQVASHFNSFMGVALVCDLRIQGGRERGG